MVPFPLKHTKTPAPTSSKKKKKEQDDNKKKGTCFKPSNPQL